MGEKICPRHRIGLPLLHFTILWSTINSSLQCIQDLPDNPNEIKNLTPSLNSRCKEETGLYNCNSNDSKEGYTRCDVTYV